MSLATKIAVTAAMVGDAQLVSLLAKDPDDPTAPALFNGPMSQAAPVYPCVTYRIASGVPDARFRPPPQAAGPSTVEDEYLEIEVWSKIPDCAEVEAIAARLIALFDGRPLSLTTGRIFRSEQVMNESDLYNEKLNVRFGLYRFRLRVAKG